MRLPFTARLCTSALALALASVVAVASPESPDIRRIGVGPSRDQLDKMELKPFPVATLAGLTNFSGGTVTADSIKSKPVLIVTWSSWIPASQQAISRANAVAEKLTEKGLIVLVVHNDHNFDTAQKFLTDKGAKNLILAKDAGGKLRSGLKSPGDPGIYLIDRAGQLRFAAIEQTAMEAAAEKVVAETPESAAAVPALIVQKEKEARESAGKTRKVEDSVEAGEARKYLKVEFPIPNSEEYDKALWPPKNDPDKGGYSLNATNAQGDKVPFDLKTVEWFTEKPEVRGRIVIFSFWGTSLTDVTERSNPLLDDLAHTYRDDLIVIAMSGYNGDLKPDIRRYLREHKSDQSQVFDVDEKIRKSMNISKVPNVFVVSTDGIVRWQGSPLDSRFRKYVEQIILQDPGARNRRLAEDNARAKLGLDPEKSKKPK